MALHLIVDGYNLIGLRPHFWQQWETERERLITRLRHYSQAKGHQVTLVFDGWRSDHPTEREERVGHLTVIYTRQGQTADEVIARLAHEYSEAGVVVSSDRAVSEDAAAAGCVTLRAGEFERRLEASAAVLSRPTLLATKTEVPVRTPTTPKRGNPRRRSKADRRKHRRLAVL